MRYRRIVMCSTACLFVALSASCISTKIHGIKVETPASTFGYFKKVESCTPTLSWKPSGEAQASYDVAVYESLGGDPDRTGTPPERGERIFYKEGIQEPQVTVTPALAAKARYLWSVRIRKPSGEVSAWSTYDKSVNVGAFFSNTKNFWFGIKTPACEQGVTTSNSINQKASEEPSQPSKLGHDYDKKSRYTDSQVVNRLHAGEGALMLGAFTYGVKNRKADLSKYRSWDEVIQSETEYRIPGYLTLYFIGPDGHEVELLPNQGTALYIFIAPPGEYILSRMTYGSAASIVSKRIFAKFRIEPGVAKYAGDFLQVQFKSILGTYVDIKPVFRFYPDRFKKYLERSYPQSLANLREERLGTGEWKEEAP